MLLCNQLMCRLWETVFDWFLTFLLLLILTTVPVSWLCPIGALRKITELLLINTIFLWIWHLFFSPGTVDLWEKAVLLAQGMQVQRNALDGSIVSVSMGSS